MVEASPWLPALSLKVQWQGLAALGLDLERLRAQFGEPPEAPDALVHRQVYLDLWEAAQSLYGRPGLPSALAMVIPFGAFGALDYLVGSAHTVQAACESAMLHFTMVAGDVWLEHDALEDGTHALRVRGDARLPDVVLEFTLACLVQRLRQISGARFEPLRVGLPVPRPADDAVRERAYGAALVHDHPCAELLLSRTHWLGATAHADPYLHATLQRVAQHLQLARPGEDELAQAVRARLRATLAEGRADPHRLASLLGVSQRTLQRRLAGRGLTFNGLVEEFRREEATRLLCDPRLPLVDIAQRLGYAEQTSFTRAFRRWTASSPGAWRAARRGGQ